MTVLTPDTIRTASETLSLLTEYLRSDPDLDEALALVAPLLDEYTGIPVQFADTLRALARVAQEDPDTPTTSEVAFLISELRSAAWEQADQHTLHYILDALRVEKRSSTEAACNWCP